MNLGILLAEAGLDREAQQAYRTAQELGHDPDPEVVAEARRRAGAETPAEHAMRLVERGDRDAARQLLAAEYGTPELGDFGVALCRQELDTAKVLASRGGDGVSPTHAGQIAIDLACLFFRWHAMATAETVMELVTLSGLRVELWEYALRTGSVNCVAVARRVADALLDTADHEVAGRIADLAAPRYPDVAARTFRHAASSAWDADDFAACVRLLERLATVSPRDASRAWFNAALAYEQLGDPAAARAALVKAKEAAPNNEEARQCAFQLGLLAKDARDLREALRWLGPIADSHHREAALAAAHLGELYHWRGEPTEAVPWYQRTLDRTSDPELVGEAAYRMGEVLLGKGDVTAARQLLRRAVESGDDTFSPQAAALLVDLQSRVSDGGGHDRLRRRGR